MARYINTFAIVKDERVHFNFVWGARPQLMISRRLEYGVKITWEISFIEKKWKMIIDDFLDLY